MSVGNNYFEKRERGRYNRISVSDGNGKKEIMEAKDPGRKSDTGRQVGNKEYLASTYCTHDDKQT